MKRIYALLFNISIISTHSVAKTNQIDSKFKSNKDHKITQKTKKEKFKFKNYKITNGDTLFTIARKHHTTVAEVQLVNKLDKDAKLKIGKTLKVPTNTYNPKKIVTNKTKQIDKKSTKKLVSSKKIKKQNKNNLYTIKKGDTLLAIAINHNTSVAKLEKLNHFKASKKLKLGEKIILSNKIKKESPKRKIINHKVISGDTLLAIANKYDTTVSTITELNNFKSDKKLKIGESIKIASNHKKVLKNDKKTKKDTKKIVAKKSVKPINHIIKKGETLYKIAQNNNTTVAKLIEINNLGSKPTLKIGSKLQLNETKKSSKIATDIKIAKSNKKISKTTKSKKIASKKKSIAKELKIAKVKKVEKKKIKIASKKPLRKKITISTETSKKSFLESLGLGSSSLKLSSAKRQLGKRYVWGAAGPYSFDCSGFTKYVCKKNGVKIPRTSIKQSKVGKRVSMKNLKAGDLIFFDTSKRHRGYVNHVGIYIGNNKFIHASSAKRKVVITSLKIPFYKSRFKWGSRVKG